MRCSHFCDVGASAGTRNSHKNFSAQTQVKYFTFFDCKRLQNKLVQKSARSFHHHLHLVRRPVPPYDDQRQYSHAPPPSCPRCCSYMPPNMSGLKIACASGADAQREAGRRSPCALPRAAVFVAVIVRINCTAPADKIERAAVLPPSTAAAGSPSIAVVFISSRHAGSLRKCSCAFRSCLLQVYQAEPPLCCN